MLYDAREFIQHHPLLSGVAICILSVAGSKLPPPWDWDDEPAAIVEQAPPERVDDCDTGVEASVRHVHSEILANSSGEGTMWNSTVSVRPLVKGEVGELTLVCEWDHQNLAPVLAREAIIELKNGRRAL